MEPWADDSGDVQDQEDPVNLDTGAKPGHAMLPDMGFHQGLGTNLALVPDTRRF